MTKFKRIFVVCLAVLSLAVFSIGANAESDVSFENGKIIAGSSDEGRTDLTRSPDEATASYQGDGISQIAVEGVEETVTFDFGSQMKDVVNGIISSLTLMLPTAITLFTIGWGLTMIPKLLKKFGSKIGG